MTMTCEHLATARKRTATLRAHLLLIAEGAIVAPGMTDPRAIAAKLLEHVDLIGNDLAGVAGGLSLLAGNVHREAEAFARELGYAPPAESAGCHVVGVAVMPFGMADGPVPAQSSNGKPPRKPGIFESAFAGKPGH